MKRFNFSTLYLLCVLCLVLVFQSCQNKEEVINPDEKGQITFEFDNVVGNRDLKLGTDTYTNGSGEQFTVTMLNYFVSNIELTKADGSIYKVPQDESYFLVKEEESESRFVRLQNIPAGDYVGVSFVIGVDSLRNTMDVSRRTGALDIGASARGMYWSWNSGYIFFKMEGISPQTPVGNDGLRKFRYHIGGFGGYSSRTLNNIQRRELSFGRDRAVIRADRTSEVHIIVDVLKIFDGSVKVSTAANPSVHFAPFSVNIAQNYSRTFEYDHLHNSSVK